jgi:tetratricopeptide (TPR) repeat protein
VFAYAEAEHFYRGAVELARELDDRAREAEALEKLGTVLNTVARYDEALVALEQAARSYHRAGLVDDEARTVFEGALVHFYRGSQDAGQAAVQALLQARGGQEPTPYLHMARAFHQWVDAWQGLNFKGCLAPAERGAALAHALGSPRLIGFWEAWRGVSLRYSWRLPEALPVLVEAVAWAEESGDLPIQYVALNMLSETYLFSGDAARARDSLERQLEVTERTRNQGWVADTLANLSAALGQLGRWPEARQHAERAVALSRLEARTNTSALPLLQMAELCILEGAWEEAHRFLTEARSISEAIDHRQWAMRQRIYLAELALREGQLEQALAHLQPALQWVSESTSPFSVLLWASPYIVLARAHLETGDIDRAEAVIQEGTKVAVATRLPLASVPWLLLQAMLLARRQTWDEAEHAFEEAVSLPRSLPFPHAEAQALEGWGRMLVAAGRPALARERLLQAVAIFEQLGARQDIERTQQALAELAE